jgi:hypothetical protein
MTMLFALALTAITGDTETENRSGSRSCPICLERWIDPPAYETGGGSTGGGEAGGVNSTSPRTASPGTTVTVPCELTSNGLRSRFTEPTVPRR